MSELSVTVPVTNSLAFLFTVLGEWWAEGKVISKGGCAVSVCRVHKQLNLPCVCLDTWVGMAFVLGGIALCVQSKNV